jgi:hypothetical protein
VALLFSFLEFHFSFEGLTAPLGNLPPFGSGEVLGSLLTTATSQLGGDATQFLFTCHAITIGLAVSLVKQEIVKMGDGGGPAIPAIQDRSSRI